MRLQNKTRDDSQAFPYRQLAILAICRLSEPIAFMSVFPYLYYMIESFHITHDEKRIALYVGMVISAFALAEALSSCIWGRLSDRLGRKAILLSGLAGTGLSMLVFGFATNIYVALLARALGGLLNGNIGVLQTTISEVVKKEAHKGVGFALMPAVWCVGAAVGSVLGGSLADPVRSYPNVFPAGGVLDRYPYLLPNLVCALIVVFAIVVGVLFLEETHEDLRERRDWGLQVGRWIESKLRPSAWLPSSGRRLAASPIDHPDETLALLRDGDAPPDYRSAASSPDLHATTFAAPPPYHRIDGRDSLDAAPVLELSDAELANPPAVAVKRSAGVWNSMTPQLGLNIISLGILA